MLSTAAYTVFPKWSIGPTVVFTFTLLCISFMLFKYPSKRNSVGYSALISAIAGFIYTTIIMVNFQTSAQVSKIGGAIVFVFYGIYLSFNFVPGLIGFLRIANEKDNSTGKFSIYFAFLWAFVTIGVGLAMTIYTALKANSLSILEDTKAVMEFAAVLTSLYEYMIYSAWVAVAVFLGLLYLCRGKIPNSLIMYSWFNLVALVQISVSSIRMIDTVGMALAYIVSNLVLCEILSALALMCAAKYGDFWKEYSERDYDEDIAGTESSAEMADDRHIVV